MRVAHCAGGLVPHRDSGFMLPVFVMPSQAEPEPGPLTCLFPYLSVHILPQSSSAKRRVT
jgi:hypothetical protein